MLPHHSKVDSLRLAFNRYYDNLLELREPKVSLRSKMGGGATHHEPIFTVRQQRILGILPLLTAPFSALGSSYILYTILVERKKTLQSVYHRLMLAISIVDLLTSMGMIILGPWAVPSTAVRYVAGARGTVATCEASGFFLNYMFASMVYAAFLALYFLCQIRFEWQERTIALFVEVPGHIVAMVFPTVNGVIGIVRNQINPIDFLPGFCYFMPYPPNCANESTVPCERGSNYMTSQAFVAIFLYSVITVSMIMIVLKVRSTELRLRRYSVGRELTLTKEAGTQALMYSGAFFLTFFPIALVELLYPYRYHRFYVIVAGLVKGLSPLQGFFNAFIYRRKRARDLYSEEGSSSSSRRFSYLSAHLTISTRQPLSRSTTPALHTSARDPEEQQVDSCTERAWDVEIPASPIPVND